MENALKSITSIATALVLIEFYQVCGAVKKSAFQEIEHVMMTVSTKDKLFAMEPVYLKMPCIFGSAKMIAFQRMSRVKTNVTKITSNVMEPALIQNYQMYGPVMDSAFPKPLHAEKSALKILSI